MPRTRLRDRRLRGGRTDTVPCRTSRAATLILAARAATGAVEHCGTVHLYRTPLIGLEVFGPALSHHHWVLSLSSGTHAVSPGPSPGLSASPPPPPSSSLLTLSPWTRPRFG